MRISDWSSDVCSSDLDHADPSGNARRAGAQAVAGMSAYFVYPFAAFCEIAGCFAFWAWWRLDRSALWLLPGLVVLALFAWLLAQVPTDEAGRAYAAYGGVYVAARSEEHTSELQSLMRISYAVFCLKKKKKK